MLKSYKQMNISTNVSKMGHVGRKISSLGENEEKLTDRSRGLINAPKLLKNFQQNNLQLMYIWVIQKKSMSLGQIEEKLCEH